MATRVETKNFSDYTEYEQEHEYETVPGVVQVPIASRTAGHRLIRLHGGYGKRVVRWQAKRFGRPPMIPAAVNTTGDTLLGTVIAPKMPRPNDQAIGGDWSVSGTYTYAQNAPRVPGTDTFPVGAYPYFLAVQSALATALGKQFASPGANFNTYYTAVGTGVVNHTTGNYIWPFLALAPVFSSDHILKD